MLTRQSLKGADGAERERAKSLKENHLVLRNTHIRVLVSETDLSSAMLFYFELCQFVNCVYFCKCLYIHQVFHTRVLDLLLNFNAV